MVSPRPQLIVTRPQPKAWWRSKTVIINLVVLILAAAETQLQVLQAVLPGDIFTWLAFVLPIVNVALRSITTQGLSLQDPAAVMAAPAAVPVPYRKGFEPTVPDTSITHESEGGHVD